MTQPDDFRPDDRRLRAALRALPAERAGEGFTEEVLARLGERAGRTAAPAPPRARVRWRQLALTAAAAAAALAVAVGGDGLWPAGPWLWIGGGVGKGGEQAHGGEAAAGSEAGGEAAARPAGAPAEPAPRTPRRGAGVDDGAAKGGGGTSGAVAAPRAPKEGADAGDGAAVGGTAAAEPGDRAAARPGMEGSGSTEGGSGGTGGTGARGRASDPARAPTGAPAAANRAGGAQRHEDSPSRGLVTTGTHDSASTTFRGLASSARPLGEDREPAGRSGSAGTTAAAQDLTGTQVAARLAALRDERERLLADLRALRAATPPEEPAGVLLAGGESIDVVLGLDPAAARSAGGDGGVRPAALQGDDRTPRLY